MDTFVQQALLTLIRLGLWENSSIRFDFVLSPTQWESVYQAALQHTVEGIVFSGIQRIPHSRIPPRDLLLKWAVRVDKIQRSNERMDLILAAQYKWFRGQGITPLLLKGQGLAVFYPHPELRVCGDIDWYLNEEQYQASKRVLKEKGKQLIPMAGFSLMYTWEGAVVEHHRHLFDVYNPFNSRYLNKIARLYRGKQSHLKCYDANIAVLPAELQLVQVACHILKHLLAFGIGLRQICDMAVLYHTFANQVDSGSLRRIYKRLGVFDWIQQLHLVLVNDLGLQEASLPFPLPKVGDGQWLLQEIMATGNFGFYDDRFGHVENPAIDKRRPHARRRLWTNFRRYLRYAPAETIAFPFVHFYSKLFAK